MQPTGLELRPNAVLSKEMHVRPLQQGEIVTYRLLEADKVSATNFSEDGTVRLMNNPAKALAKMTRVRDVITGEIVLIGNVIGTRQVKNPDGTIRTEYQTGPVNLKRDITVTAEQFDLYQYLERHNANTDNPFRDRTKQPVFYRVNRKKRALEEQNQISMKADAISWTRDADLDEIKAINKALPDNLKVDMNKDTQEIRTDLMRVADQHPITVLRASSNKEALAHIIVMECENYGIAIWDDDNRKWFFNDKEQETITHVEIGTDRIKGFVDHIRKDEEGRKTFLRMQNKLKKFREILLK